MDLASGGVGLGGGLAGGGGGGLSASDPQATSLDGSLGFNQADVIGGGSGMQMLLMNQNISEEEELKLLNFPPKQEDLSTAIPLTVIFGLLLVTGCIGNLCTAIVIARPKNKYMHTATNYYLFSLAMSDFLFLILGLPQEMYTLWQRYPYAFGEWFCIIRSYLSEASTYASILTISAFTVERYVAICHPLWAHTMSQLPRAITSIVIIWIVSAICAIPPAAELGIVTQKGPITNRTLDESAQCASKNPIYENLFVVSAIVFFIVPMIIVTVLYILIAIELRRSSKMNSAISKQSSSQLAGGGGGSSASNSKATGAGGGGCCCCYHQNEQHLRQAMLAGARPAAGHQRAPLFGPAAAAASIQRLKLSHQASCTMSPSSSLCFSPSLAAAANNNNNNPPVVAKTRASPQADQSAGRTPEPGCLMLDEDGGRGSLMANIMSQRPSSAIGNEHPPPAKARSSPLWPIAATFWLTAPPPQPQAAAVAAAAAAQMAPLCHQCQLHQPPAGLHHTQSVASEFPTNGDLNPAPPRAAHSPLSYHESLIERHQLTAAGAEAGAKSSPLLSSPVSKFRPAPTHQLSLNHSSQSIAQQPPQAAATRSHQHSPVSHQPHLNHLQSNNNNNHHPHHHHHHNHQQQQLHRYYNSNNNNNNNGHHLHHHHHHQQSRRSAAASSKKSVVRMLVAVVVSFFICWVPFHAQRLLASYLSKGENQNQLLLDIYHKLTYISGVMYYLSSTINPLLYQLMSAKFRLAFKETFHCSLFRCLSCCFPSGRFSGSASAGAARKHHHHHHHHGHSHGHHHHHQHHHSPTNSLKEANLTTSNSQQCVLAGGGGVPKFRRIDSRASQLGTTELSGALCGPTSEALGGGGGGGGDCSLDLAPPTLANCYAGAVDAPGSSFHNGAGVVARFRGRLKNSSLVSLLFRSSQESLTLGGGGGGGGCPCCARHNDTFNSLLGGQVAGRQSGAAAAAAASLMAPDRAANTNHLQPGRRRKDSAAAPDAATCEQLAASTPLLADDDGGCCDPERQRLRSAAAAAPPPVPGQFAGSHSMLKFIRSPTPLVCGGPNQQQAPLTRVSSRDDSDSDGDSAGDGADLEGQQARATRAESLHTNDDCDDDDDDDNDDEDDDDDDEGMDNEKQNHRMNSLIKPTDDADADADEDNSPITSFILTTSGGESGRSSSGQGSSPEQQQPHSNSQSQSQSHSKQKPIMMMMMMMTREGGAKKQATRGRRPGTGREGATHLAGQRGPATSARRIKRLSSGSNSTGSAAGSHEQQQQQQQCQLVAQTMSAAANYEQQQQRPPTGRHGGRHRRRSLQPQQQQQHQQSKQLATNQQLLLAAAAAGQDDANEDEQRRKLSLDGERRQLSSSLSSSERQLDKKLSLSTTTSAIGSYTTTNSQLTAADSNGSSAGFEPSWSTARCRRSSSPAPQHQPLLDEAEMISSTKTTTTTQPKGDDAAAVAAAAEDEQHRTSRPPPPPPSAQQPQRCAN